MGTTVAAATFAGVAAAFWRWDKMQEVAAAQAIEPMSLLRVWLIAVAGLLILAWAGILGGDGALSAPEAEPQHLSPVAQARTIHSATDARMAPKVRLSARALAA